MDQHPVIQGQPYQHMMDRFARSDAAAVLVGEGIGFGINEAGFDIPEPVVPLIALDPDGPGVDQLTGRGSG